LRPEFHLDHGEIGPGSYDANPVKPRSSSPDFGHSLGRLDHIDLNPGPGEYKPNKEKTMYESPKWTILGRRPEQPHALDPHDFLVEKSFGADSKNFTIPPEIKLSPQRATVGPGEYDWNKGIQASKPRAPSAIIEPESVFQQPEPGRQT
jgi:hypothetical protein